MSGRNRFYVGTCIVSLSLLLLWPGAAQAYIGPGAGLELIPMALGLLSFVVAMFCTILLWPFYTLIRWLRGSKEKPITKGVTECAGEEAVAEVPLPLNQASTITNVTITNVLNQPQPSAQGPQSAMASEGRRDGDQANS